MLTTLKCLVNKGGCSARRPPNLNVSQCTKLPLLSTLANLFPTLLVLYKLTNLYMHSCATIIMWAWTATVSFSCNSSSPRVGFPKPNIFIQFLLIRQRTTRNILKLMIDIHPSLTKLFHHPWDFTKWWARLQSFNGLEDHATRRERSTAEDFMSAKRLTKVFEERILQTSG